MEQRKLLQLLRTFSRRDWNAFQAFVASPYFNRNQDLVVLAAWLARKAPGFSALQESDLWGAVNPGEPFDSRQLNHLLSWLLKLAEQFLGQENFVQDRFESDWRTAEALFQRGLPKHYQFTMGRLRRGQRDFPHRNGVYWLQQYRLADLELRANVDQTSARHAEDSLQVAADQLDNFYLTEKLKYACTMLNNQAIVASAYQFHLVEEVRQYVEQHPVPAEAPGIALYFRVFQMLSRANGDADFQELKQLLRRHTGQFPAEEMAWLYSYALNYCIGQIRNAREEYLLEALNLYEEGVESGVLLTSNGQLSPWHFKNIVKLALRLRRFDWAERFIRGKNALLPADFQQDALHYNLSELFFYTKRYDDALQHLNRVEFTDVHYNLGAKEMLAKIYFETDAWDALDSLLHAFKIYLQRNHIIAETARKAYLNFIRILRLRLRATREQFPQIQALIEKTDLLTAKNWLLDQVA